MSDIGRPISSIFSSFDLEPIGVASLAQVHKATLLDGREVAVKIQHPALQEFSTVDIRTVAALTQVVAYVFPEFEFTWLSEEMQTSLPKELNFDFEAANAARVAANFDSARKEGSKSTIKIPDVIWSRKRVLVMECKSFVVVSNALGMTRLIPYLTIAVFDLHSHDWIKD